MEGRWGVRERFDECDRCGREHLPRHAPPIGSRIAVVAGEFAGRRGRLYEWSRYGCPLYYRIEFDDPNPDYGGKWRENVQPCETAPDRAGREAAASGRPEHDPGDEDRTQ